MKLLIFGDVYGRVGRKALQKELPKLISQLNPDFTIVNIENITSGRGPVAEHARFVTDLGADILTSGDHIFDNAESIIPYLEADNSNLLRPANYYEKETPISGKGYKIFTKNSQRLLVIDLLGEAFMRDNVYNPFVKVDEILESISRDEYDVCIVEFHRETTAEIAGMWHHLDGRVHGVYGTHTHVQTADAATSPTGGTCFISDVGMNGPFGGVIGAEYSSVKPRFLSGIQKGKIEQSLSKTYQINACVFDINTSSPEESRVTPIYFTATL